MPDSVFIGRSAAGYTTTPAFASYTKVIINIDDDNYVEAGVGDNALELSCPWATAQMAADILESIKGYSYQPYDTDWAKLDPAAELGDGVTINGVFSGIFTKETMFSALVAARMAAPQDNAVDHEYPYKSQTDRKVTRQFSEVRASLRVNADNIAAEVQARKNGEEEMRATLQLHASEIAARVTQTGGNSRSFGWSLTADGFILSSNGRQVFKATKNGVDITGKITATSGFIGNGSSGFTISSSAIYNALSSLYGSTNGVYIGTDGIALGGGRFRVDSYGNLYATSGTFTGNVYANQIQVGGNAGYIEGSQVGYSTISTANTNGYLNGGVANGYYSGDVFSGAAIASTCGAGSMQVTNGNSLYLWGSSIHKASSSFKTGGGSTISLKYLTW